MISVVVSACSHHIHARSLERCAKKEGREGSGNESRRGAEGDCG